MPAQYVLPAGCAPAGRRSDARARRRRPGALQRVPATPGDISHCARREGPAGRGDFRRVRVRHRPRAAARLTACISLGRSTLRCALPASRADVYIKEAGNTKALAKAAQYAEQFCSRLGAYRMPFAWGAFALFGVAGRLEVNAGGDQTIRPLFRQESERLSVRVSAAARAFSQLLVRACGMAASPAPLMNVIAAVRRTAQDDDLLKCLADFRKGTLTKKLKVAARRAASVPRVQHD